MTLALHRRNFLALSAAASAGLLASSVRAAEFKTRLYKAMIRRPTEAEMTKLKESGFDGLEVAASDRGVSPEQAAKARTLAEKLGLKIHSVLWGWANFNSPDPLVIAKELAELEKSLRACQAYGATALLLVTCRVDPKAVGPIPDASEFDIEFDEKTGHVKRVVKGDNAKYEGYIKAHNQATDMSRKAVEKLIPAAEKCQTIIALENVGNNLWVKPALFAHFVKSFANPWVQSYFDIGNHVRYAPPEEWIRALGKTLVRLHAKDYKLDKTRPRGGYSAQLREGSVDWPAVRKELENIGYNGFLTVEGERISLKECNDRLDLIIAGK